MVQLLTKQDSCHGTYLVKRCSVPIYRLEIGLWRWHLNVIRHGPVEGTIAADAEVGARRLDQRLNLGLDQPWLCRRRSCREVARQTVTLRDIEDGKALQERNPARSNE
jgi:hypothetical protein